MTAQYSWSNPVHYKILLHLTFLHIIPLCTTVANFLLTNVILIDRDWQIYLSSGMIYALVNYAITKIKGNPVYAVLPWSDYKSPLIIILLLTLAIAIHFGLVKLSYCLRRGPNPDLE